MIYVLLIVGMFALVAVGSTIGLGTGTITVIGIAVVLFLVLKGEKKDKNALKTLQEQTKSILTVDKNTGRVTITQRHKAFAKLFTCENYVSTRHGYAEEKLIFTSATVGGVTTGGVEKVGGYGTEKKKTDKCNLVYQYVDPKNNQTKKVYVTAIQLSESLRKSAKLSKIKEYLDGNSLIVVTPLVSSEKEKQAYLNLHRISGGGYSTHLANLEEDDRIRTLPTLQKCNDIISWISGNG